MSISQVITTPSTPPSTPYKSGSPTPSQVSTRTSRHLPSIDLAARHGKRPSLDNDSPSSASRRPLPSLPNAPCSATTRRSPCWSAASIRRLPLPPTPQSAPPTTASTPCMLDAVTPFTRRKFSVDSTLPSYQSSQIDSLNNPWPRTFEETELTPLDDASLLNPWPVGEPEEITTPSISISVAPPIPSLTLPATIPEIPEIVLSPSEIPEITFSTPVIPELSFIDTSSDSDEDEDEDDEDASFSETNTSLLQSPAPPSPPKPTLPSLNTKNLSFLSTDPSEVSLSPFSPAYVAPPTPQTVKRNRLRKLRRFLGESLPADAVYAPLPQETKQKVIQDIASRRSRDVTDTTNKYIQAAIVVSKILDISSDDEDDEDSDAEGAEWTIDDKRSTGQYTTGTKEDYNWVLENGIAFKAAGKRRFSRKWLHEKGQSRWEEPDYQNVISALRAL